MKEKLVKEKDRELFFCETNGEVEDIQDMYKFFPEFYWIHTIITTLLILICMVFYSVISQRSFSLLAFIIFSLIGMIYTKVKLNAIAANDFKNIKKTKPEKVNYVLSFYEDYLIRKTENTSIKFNYNKMKRLIETDDNFYLDMNDLIIVIHKNTCDLELINFIRNIKSNNLENCLGDKHPVGKIVKRVIPQNAESILNLLYTLTILSVMGSLITLSRFMTYGSFIQLDAVTWIHWLWLIIPITSIVFGFKYKKSKLPYKKNIVAGILVAAFICYSSYPIYFPNTEVEYKEIEQYKEIVNFSLPSEGRLFVDDSRMIFRKNISDFKVWKLYFNKKDFVSIEKEIDTSSEWILIEDISDELEQLIPILVSEIKGKYISIYNYELQSYNILPNESGEYHICFMTMIPEDRYVELDTYVYTYNKPSDNNEK